MHKDYTNGELGILLEAIRTDTEEIKKQVTSTNGRVKSLELWRMFLIGAWAVITLITPIGWLLMANSIDEFKSSIDQRITDAIQNNNNKYFEE